MRRLAALLCFGLALALAPLRAAEVADYRFDDTLASSIAGAPPLQAMGGAGGFVDVVLDGQPRRAWGVVAGSGFSLSSLGLLPQDRFSVMLQISAAELGGYAKLIDTRSLVLDHGIYLSGDSFAYFPYYDDFHTQLLTHTFYWLTVTRAPSGEVVGYVDGVEDFRFDDSDGNSAISADQRLVFFVDDDETNGEETFAGRVTRIRLFDTVLSSPQVRHLTRQPALFRDGFEAL